MGALRLLATASLLAWSNTARAQSVERWSAYISEASERFAIPEPWIRHVMAAESAGRTSLHGRPTLSPKGAMGLMQIMPVTWSEIRMRLGLGQDPYDPRDNILAGAAYLRAMYDRFGYPGLFAAYNAGPGRYAKHLAGAPLPLETITYLREVAGSAAPSSRQTGRIAPPIVKPASVLFAATATLFAIAPSSAAHRAQDGRSNSRLFFVPR
jgi:soluble lytic murein transglycosylase-like protein